MSRAQLALALNGLPAINDPRILVGTSTADDAGVISLSPDLALVHTVDVFAPVVDDPYTFGRIAAVNSLSDVYAMGGDPLGALNVVGFPGNLDISVLADILRGGQDAIIEAGAAPLGGHTFQSSELRYGLAVTGKIHPDRIITNAQAKRGDRLILTKPLGAGTVIQALMIRGAVNSRLLEECQQSMLSSNRTASEIMRKYANACTDVTGFGLLGHLWEMVEGSGVGADMFVSELPVFEGVLDLIREGVMDAGVKPNRNSFEENVRFADAVPAEARTLLFGAETSGGLLIAVPSHRASEMRRELTDQGCLAAEIGIVTDTARGKVKVC
ncbi:MAG: selenide, water dikinase SelD [Calditrichota bacterium]